MSQGLHFICLCQLVAVSRNILSIQRSRTIRASEAINTENIKWLKNCDSDADAVRAAGWSTRLTRSCFILLHDNISADLSVHCMFCWMLFRMFPYTKLYSCSLDLVPSSCTTSTPESAMIFVCLTYMGQTCPSNRPGGSGTV